MQMAFLSVEDLRLPASPVLFHPEVGLVFARVVASREEARGLRHALSAGRMVGVRLPNGRALWVPLKPGTHSREEAIWVKGLPRTRMTLYLPAGRAHDGQRWLFLVGRAGNFYELIEAVSAFPVPSPIRRLEAETAAKALVAMSTGQEGPPTTPDVLRLGLALEARTAPSGQNARFALPTFVRPLEGVGPEGWIALGVREDFLPVLLEVLRT